MSHYYDSYSDTFVHHVRGARFDLRFDDGEPKLLSLDCSPNLSFSLVFLIQLLKLLAVAVMQAGTFVRTHERPRSIFLDALHVSPVAQCTLLTTHKQVWNPESQEQVAGTSVFHTRVLAQVQEFKDIIMPWFQVAKSNQIAELFSFLHGKGTIALASTLVHMTGSIVKYSQHGYNSIGLAIGSSDVATSGTNALHAQTNSTRGLGDQCASLQGIVDPFNATRQSTKGRLTPIIPPYLSSFIWTKKQLDIWGRGVPALNRVGVACVNHFSESNS